MAPENNMERRAAKKLAAYSNLNYTEALRRVRTSGLQPSEIMGQINTPESEGDKAIRQLLEHASSPEPLTREELLTDYSTHGRFAFWTDFGDDARERNRSSVTPHLLLIGRAGRGKTTLLNDLLQPVESMPTRVVAWDAGGGLSSVADYPVHADIEGFHRELSEMLSGSFRGPAIVAVDGLYKALDTHGKDAPQQQLISEVRDMLIRVLREGRDHNMSLYVTDQLSSFWQQKDRQFLLNGAELVLMGGRALDLEYSPSTVADLPPMTKGWLVMNSSSSMYQVHVAR